MQCSIPLHAHTTTYLSILLMVDMWVDSSLGLTWGHQAFHWPWGEGPEGWVVRWDSHPPRLQSPPALAAGAAAVAAAAADSASFVSASWLRQWLQRDLEGSEEGARWDSISASGRWMERLRLPPFHFRKAPRRFCAAHSLIKRLPRSLPSIEAVSSLLFVAFL